MFSVYACVSALSGPGRPRSLPKDAAWKKRWTHTGYTHSA